MEHETIDIHRPQTPAAYMCNNNLVLAFRSFKTLLEQILTVLRVNLWHGIALVADPPTPHFLLPPTPLTTGRKSFGVEA